MMKWPVNFHPLHTWCKSSIKYGWIFTLSILEGSSVPKVKRVHWAWTCWYCQPFCLIHQCQIEEEKRSGQTLYKVEKWVVCSRWPLYSAHTSTKNNNDQVIRNLSLSLSLSLWKKNWTLCWIDQKKHVAKQVSDDFQLVNRGHGIWNNWICIVRLLVCIRIYLKVEDYETSDTEYEQENMTAASIWTPWYCRIGWVGTKRQLLACLLPRSELKLVTRTRFAKLGCVSYYHRFKNLLQVSLFGHRWTFILLL